METGPSLSGKKSRIFRVTRLRFTTVGNMKTKKSQKIVFNKQKQHISAFNISTILQGEAIKINY